MDGVGISGLRTVVERMRLHRRAALKAGIAGIAGAASARDAVAQQATPAAGDDEAGIEFLFVQSFASGELAPMPSESATPAPITPFPGATPVAIEPAEYRLTLREGLGQTLYFSDRPERIVGTVPTQQFLDGLGFTPLNPPNAALVGDLGNGDEDILVAELTNPQYDAASATLTYDVRVLDGFDRVDMQFSRDAIPGDPGPERFGATHLFIDDCPDAAFTCTTPDAWLACISPGTFDGGTCWQWESLTCVPCRDYAAECNALYPGFCKGNCIVKSQQEVRQQCIGR